MSFLLDLAFSEFEDRKFRNSDKLCREILLLSPEYPVALELIEIARNAAEQPEWHELGLQRVENWRKLMDSSDSVPYSTECRMPSADEWREITGRISQSHLTPCDYWGNELSPGVDPLQMSIQLATGEGRLAESLNLIHEETRLPVILDKRLRNSLDLEQLVMVHVGTVTVRQALDLIASLFGVSWELTENRCIFITRGS